MAKTISFEYQGVDYTLEFNRRTVSNLELAGFNPEKASSMLATSVPMLFEGSFKMHHPHVKHGVVMDIFKMMPDKVKLLDRLIEMYNDALNTMLADPDESEGNVNWTSNW